MAITNKHVSVVFAIVLIVVIIFIVSVHFILLIPGTDAGIFMYGSKLITEGRYPYIDLWDDKPPLIYLIGTIGFLLKANPFLGIRIFDVLLFSMNLYLLNKICKLLLIVSVIDYLLSFSALYLIFWDQGFLTETYNIPLVLLALYFFIKKIPYYELILSLFIVMCFLLKPNSIIVLCILALTDIFSNYRKANWGVKLLSYILGVGIFSTISVLVLVKLNMWLEYISQAFTFNFLYIKQHSFADLIYHHIAQHSLSSIIGIIVFVLFNFLLLSSLFKYRKLFLSKVELLPTDHLILLSGICFYVAFYFTYMSNRTYPHYFILLIIPTTFILGNYNDKYFLGRIGILCLVVFGIIMNANTVKNYYANNKEKIEIITFAKANTTEKEHIYVLGMSDAWIYLYSNRLSNTRYINAEPFFETSYIQAADSCALRNDFIINKPAMIIIDKADQLKINTRNYYFHTINNALENYNKVFENKMYCIYKLKA